MRRRGQWVKVCSRNAPLPAITCHTMSPDRPALLQLSPEDNCAIALRAIARGEALSFSGRQLQALQDIPLGHKVALIALQPGDKVLRYGARIGSVTVPVQPGEHLHIHNLKSDYLPAYTFAHPDNAHD